jgi:putative transposase
LAAIIDGYSRKIVGWSVDSHMRTTLVTDALRMAIERQRPGIGDVVIHSDYAEVFVNPRMCGFSLPRGPCCGDFSA